MKLAARPRRTNTKLTTAAVVISKVTVIEDVDDVEDDIWVVFPLAVSAKAV